MIQQIVDLRQGNKHSEVLLRQDTLPTWPGKASKDLTHSEELYKMFLSQAISNA